MSRAAARLRLSSSPFFLPGVESLADEVRENVYAECMEEGRDRGVVLTAQLEQRPRVVRFNPLHAYGCF